MRQGEGLSSSLVSQPFLATLGAAVEQPLWSLQFVFWSQKDSVNVSESTCDYMSRGFLKLAGPPSVLLIGRLADLGASSARDAVMVRTPCSGGGHRVGAAEGRLEVRQPGCSQVLCRGLHAAAVWVPCACARECIVETVQILVTIEFLEFLILAFLEQAAKERVGCQGAIKRWSLKVLLTGCSGPRPAFVLLLCFLEKTLSQSVPVCRSPLGWSRTLLVPPSPTSPRSPCP